MLELLQFPLISWNAIWCVPDKWTAKTWILFLGERIQNSKTMSMYMPSDCAQACRGTSTGLFAHIQKSLTCLSVQFLRKEIQPSCVAEKVYQVRVLTYYTRLAGYKTVCPSRVWLFSNQVVFRWKPLYKPNVRKQTIPTMWINLTKNKL